MFAWLKKVFGKKDAEPGVDLFRPKERKLYGYWNGQEVVWQDPLVLYKKLMAVMPELSVNVKIANSPIDGNANASNALVKQICEVFDVTCFTDAKKGLTHSELMALLVHFLHFCDTVKKNIPGSVKPPPTSPPSVLPTEPVHEDVPTTSSTLDSTSTNELSNTDPLTESPSESVSPSASSSPPLITLGPTLTEKVTPS